MIKNISCKQLKQMYQFLVVIKSYLYFVQIKIIKLEDRFNQQIVLETCNIHYKLRLLYSLKCLKLYTCFLCLDDIYNKLIVDQTDLPADTPIKAFHEAINKYPDPLS